MVRIYCIDLSPVRTDGLVGGSDWFWVEADRDARLAEYGYDGTPFDLEVPDWLTDEEITTRVDDAAWAKVYTPVENHVRVYLGRVSGVDEPVLFYEYAPDNDSICRFHMLCEVGQPWVPNAARKLQDLANLHHHKTVQVLELAHEPWVVEVLR